MYIKANLDQILYHKIIFIVKNLTSYLPGFIDQLNELAGLGSHPYHITLIGRIHNNFSKGSEIDSFLKYWNKDTDIVEITIINHIKITNTGRVLLMIDSPYLGQIAEEMFSSIKNRVSLYSEQHITLGKVFDQSLFGKSIYMSPEFYENINGVYYINSFGWDY